MNRTAQAEDYIVKVTVPPEIEVRENAVEKLKECEEFLNSCSSLSTRMALHLTLQRSLEHIANIAKNYPDCECWLGYDFAPLSFTWAAGNLYGGLIFHGPHDGFGSGGAPTFSVSLDNTAGWQLHT